MATCAREWSRGEIIFLDAIAMGRTEEDVIHTIRAATPDVLVFVAGLDIFDDDMACIGRIKKAFPHLVCMAFGHLPTHYPEVILRNSAVDYILCREPERPLSDYLAARQSGQPVETVPGLAGRRADGSVFVNPESRIEDLDALPFPDYSLIDLDLYEEAFLGKRCGAILSARGCPFSCNYCTLTYGRRLVMKSPEKVVAEMAGLLAMGAQSLRFLDDTFTCNRQRTIAICKGIVDRGLHVDWSCLARIDTLDAEIIEWLRRAGCKRILVGIESYSANVLGQLHKAVDPATINPTLVLIRDAGIQVFGFFMVGMPFETAADFEDTLHGALAAPLDFIIVCLMTPYPGTAYFHKHLNEIEFSLFPYICEFKDTNVSRQGQKRHRRLFLRFYLRPRILLRQLRLILRHPLRLLHILVMMAWFSAAWVLRFRAKKDLPE